MENANTYTVAYIKICPSDCDMEVKRMGSGVQTSSHP